MPVDHERVAAIFEKLRQRSARLADGATPEQVHDFRSSCRRVESILEGLAGGRAGGEKKLLKLIGRLRKAAGKVRDLDAQVAALRSLKIPQQPRHKTQLLQEMSGARDKQEKKLRKSLDKKTVRELRQRARRALKRLEIPEGVDPLAVARKLAAEVTPEAAAFAARQEHDLHALRIRAKRARYIAQLAKDSTGRTELVAALRSLQDAIGDWHDWRLITERAEKMFGGVRDSALVAALHNVTRAKYRNAVETLKNRVPEPAARRRQASSGARAAATQAA